MTALSVPSSNALPAKHFGLRLISYHTSAAGFLQSYSPGWGGAMTYCLGIDVTAVQGTSPEQTFVDMLINGSCFYHDSQSIGEGAGVTYSWRGQLPISTGETLTVIGTSADTENWSCVAWGIWGVYQPYP